MTDFNEIIRRKAHKGRFTADEARAPADEPPKRKHGDGDQGARGWPAQRPSMSAWIREQTEAARRRRREGE